MIKPFVVIGVIVFIVLFASETILGQLASLHIIGTKGTLRVFGVGVYSEANCSNLINYVDWGSVEPYSEKNVTVFIRNEGNGPATLFLVADNWNPPNASDCMTLKWDYKGQIIYPKDTVRVTLTLSIALASEEIRDFSFDIKIGVN